MRILFATSIKTWGGGEEWMLTTAAEMGRRGHRVSLAARPGSAILSRGLQLGIPCFEAPFRFDGDFLSFARVHRHCMHHHVDVLCCNTDRALRVAGTAARMSNVPVILPRRGSESPLKRGFLYRWAYQRVATGVIVNSQATRKTLLRDVAWRPRGRVHVLLNGVALERFDSVRPREKVRRELGVGRDDPILIVVGELTERKNVALLLRVAPRLAERFPGLTVLVAGEGKERGRLEEMARAQGLGDRVRLLGFRKDIPDLLSASDVLVHPARVEGFGYAVAEAMAAGIPAVATDASSLPEIVDHGRTGLLFPPEDAGALERALTSYLEDASLRARHGAAGRERARAEFGLQRRLLEFEDILKCELAGRHGPENGT